MKRTPEGVLMDYQLIRAYCAKDLNGILQPRDKWHSTPESRWDELEHRILLKHRTGARYLEPRQYAAAVCLRALEMLDIPFLADGNYPEFTQADSIETGRVTLADALNDYIPHLSASEAAPLLPVNAELQQFKLSVTPQQTAPATDAATPAPVVADEIDFTMVATRTELIDAFGKFTDMNMAWFDNLTDAPKLKAARKFTGQGGRHSAEPLFCPYEVMQWLADPKRRKGKPLSNGTAWRLLKGSFPKVYNQYSIGDPNAN